MKSLFTQSFTHASRMGTQPFFRTVANNPSMRAFTTSSPSLSRIAQARFGQKQPQLDLDFSARALQGRVSSFQSPFQPRRNLFTQAKRYSSISPLALNASLGVRHFSSILSAAGGHSTRHSQARHRQYFHQQGRTFSSGSRKTAAYSPGFFALVGVSLLGAGILLQDQAFCKQANPEIIGPFKMSESGEIEENRNYYVVDGIPFLGEDRTYLERCVKNRDGLLRLKPEDDHPFFPGNTQLLATWLKSRPHPFLYLAPQKGLEGVADIKKIRKTLDANREAFRDRASPYECAQFAVLAYDDSVNPEGLPDGWESLRLLRDRGNGYFGRVFVNHQTGNVIIAHRGTEFPSSWDQKEVVDFLKDLYVDYSEILKNKIGSQQRSGISFSRRVYDQVNPYGYRIGCVGHSLGGWLAQLTTADLRRERGHEEAYAVCLDSPGAKKMLDSYYRTRYGLGEERGTLDVVNYMLAPNLVNTLGVHEGTLYQVASQAFEKELRVNAPKSWFFSNAPEKLKFYLLKTHSKELILNAFQQESKLQPQTTISVEEWPSIPWETLVDFSFPYERILQNIVQCLAGPNKKSIATMVDVIDMSVGFAKRGYAFTNMLSILENFHIEEKNSFSMRYNIGYKAKSFDSSRVSMLNISPSVRELFRHFHSLRQHGVEPLEAFARKVAVKICNSENEFDLLCNITVEGGVCSVAQKRSAFELRRRAAMLLKAFPKLAKEVNFLECIFFQRRLYPRLQTEEMRLYPSSHHAIPRNNVIQKIDECFSNGAQASQSRNIVYLCGPAGSGKSEVAAQYCRRFEDSPEGRNTFIVYFDASNLEAFNREWLRFAVAHLGVEYSYSSPPEMGYIVEEGRKKLKNLPGYLLVFNRASVESFETIQNNYLPENPEGRILVTTSSSIENGCSVSMETCAVEEQLDVRPLLISREHPLRAAVDQWLNGSHSDTQELLSKSPLLARLIGRRIQKDNSIACLNELNQSSQENNLIDEAINGEIGYALSNTNEDNATEILSNAILNSLATFPSQNISEKLLKEWILSKEARSSWTGNISSEELNEYIERLENYGILQQQGDSRQTKNRMFSIHPRVYENMMERAEAPDNLQDNILSFFSKKGRLSMNNIAYSDFQRQAVLRTQLAPLIISTTSDDKSLLSLTRALNCVANNALQSELYIQSEQLFSQVRQRCKQRVKLDNEEDIENMAIRLKEVNQELVGEYARALHYLGKIYFQSGAGNRTEDRKKSRLYFERAIKMNTFREKSRAKKVDALIFQRQGIGWHLIESDSPEDWRSALDLYQSLREQDDYYLNHYYCNLQMGRAYRKYAKTAKTPATKRHYYTKALERLKFGGRHEGIPFKSALTCVQNKGNKDAEAEILLEIGGILGDKLNPQRDCQEAEQVLLCIFRIEQELSNKNKQLRTDTLFRTYASLAKLYMDQRSNHPYAHRVRAIEDADYLEQAQGNASHALTVLQRAQYETLSMLRLKRDQEIQEMEEIVRKN